MPSCSTFTITAASTAIVRAPLATLFRIATGQHTELANVFLRLQTGDGQYGFGEAAVATHITGETVEQTLANLQAAAAILNGRTIDDTEAVCGELAHSPYLDDGGRFNLAPAGPGIGAEPPFP